ncbi:MULTISPECIES: carbohydrate ABC transporter permease [unclassified Frondihabitans]|jgi:raffinose/stachyose/melibiose transport system permease protein|uniref:carbohydrate ABC transporter permease n=1 Tax=unclassified Frondihabitans TaxID=2626248 RepID=UPI000F4ECA41|nr:MULTISPECIES: carbohydrate ABC transporter permease [unclassified Frondihabitans]MBF4574595.1 carbohydrate ABC transporter permease [Frondihabitans sp. VKM Ac-2883]RPE76037.1 raffinose/stachyose/melibiose transport system permease protein [Frondihabitans sp. PhB153]RPF05686.1 raffinose/stachyose/melibiose transport system permease protein [Frondihabitans sp. PhB161]
MKVGTRESVGTHALLIIAALFAVYPLASIISSSLQKSSGSGVGWSNFSVAWTRGHFASALVASALVAVTVVVVTAIVATLAGYALATMRVPGGKLILGLLLVGLVLPYEVTVLPLYQMLAGWGLVDTYWALILPQIGLSVPLGVFWMRTFFRSVPEEILEAARLDGASRFQILRLVLVPIAGPAVATLATILFLFTWNEFLLALILVPENQAVQTAPLALSFFSGTDRAANPNVTAAAAVLVALPIIVAYVILQRRLITGLTSGAVK